MNPPDSLPLRDIHLPESVSWWPPAWGWWLSAILLIVIMLLISWLIKSLRKPVLRKRAIAEINAVIKGYQQHADKEILLQQISIALRRIVISYRNRPEVAGLTGEHWAQEIFQLDRKKVLSIEMISMLSCWPYQDKPQISDQDVELLMEQLQNWTQFLPRDEAHA